MIGVVGAADQRPGFDDLEAAGEAFLLEERELLGRHPAIDGQVVPRGLEVLADGEHVTIITA